MSDHHDCDCSSSSSSESCKDKKCNKCHKKKKCCERGPRGHHGSKGCKGDTGAQGPQGVKGDTGAQGQTGSTGPTGAPGTAGAKGDTGATGPSGATGASGVPGAKGETGATGPAGPNQTDEISNLTPNKCVEVVSSDPDVTRMWLCGSDLVTSFLAYIDFATPIPTQVVVGQTRVGGAGPSIELLDIAISTTGIMYGINTTTLYTVNTANGDLAVVGPVSFSANGMCFDINNRLWASGVGNLYQVDPATGALLLTVPLPFLPASAGDIAFFGDIAYLTTNDIPNGLYFIDTSSLVNSYPSTASISNSKFVGSITNLDPNGSDFGMLGLVNLHYGGKTFMRAAQSDLSPPVNRNVPAIDPFTAIAYDTIVNTVLNYIGGAASASWSSLCTLCVDGNVCVDGDVVSDNVVTDRVVFNQGRVQIGQATAVFPDSVAIGNNASANVAKGIAVGVGAVADNLASGKSGLALTLDGPNTVVSGAPGATTDSLIVTLNGVRYKIPMTFFP